MAATKTRTSCSLATQQFSIHLIQAHASRTAPMAQSLSPPAYQTLTILGGGFPPGSLVMIMEDAEAPHQMLLLRNFMAQGLVHSQLLLYASPASDPRGFLVHCLVLCGPKMRNLELRILNGELINWDFGYLILHHEKGLRIAWRYKKYLGEQQPNLGAHRDSKHEYCSDFDLRKPLERHFLTGQHISCVSIQDPVNLTSFHEHCSTFLNEIPRNNGSTSCIGRIAIQSFCAPQCGYSNMDWDMLSFIRSLKSMIQSSNAVAVITFPPSLLSPSFCKRWQHLSDILLSVPVILDATTFSIKLQKR
ncbi:Elongator complex protein 4, partial [Dillenia turbinata]